MEWAYGIAGAALILAGVFGIKIAWQIARI
jgi:ABC-type sulfate transport system permease component